MRISVIGSGYVGLVSGVCLAGREHDIICADSDIEVVRKINNAEATIYEPLLSEYLKKAVASGKLSATADLRHAVMNSDISIVAVGTPCRDGAIDLGCIEKAARDIGRLLSCKEAYHVVCIKSTVVPGTTDTLVKELLETESGKKAGEFGLVMNPEFLREGEAVMDFLHPDRIVIGAYDDRSFGLYRQVYGVFPDVPVIRVGLRTAELIKYASNSLLAMLISFSNEMAAVSEAAGGIDIEEVLYGVSMDRRLSPYIDGRLVRPDILKYLKAGRGYGGSCLPKDVKALEAFAEQKGYSTELLKAVTAVNKKQVGRIIERLERELNGFGSRRILVLGLAFKQNSDDIRESPAIELVKLLVEKGASVSVNDPMAMKNARLVLDEERIDFLQDFSMDLEGFDAIILMTPWQEYLEVLNNCSCKALKTTLLFDGCRALDKNRITGSGIKYMGIGLS